MRSASIVLFAASVWLGAAGAAQAENDCEFRTIRDTWFLQRDCTTDTTIEIPDGVTLDGRGRTITAVDPAEGHFLGAVIRNAGATMHVRRLTIETLDLADICDEAAPDDQRLRGIWLVNASGTIVGNEVFNIRQEGSGCQEGVAIDVDGQPVDQATAVQRVTIAGNRIDGYQKAGITVGGAVEVSITLNRIEGLGPVDYIAQNGIQIAQGAHGSIHWNRIEQNIYARSDAAGAGVLVVEAGTPLEIERNRIEDNDVGVRVKSTSDALVQWNEINGSTYDGIALDGQVAATERNRLVRNRLDENSFGIEVYGAGATTNQILGNRIEDSLEVGLQILLGATNNVVWANQVSGSGTLDIVNEGYNGYLGNSCASSSGAPVDCP